MMTISTLGGIMEKMTRHLAAAAVVAGVAVLGAGCAANAAAPAGGHPSAAAAGSPALPNPFTITARYSAKSLGLDHPGALATGPDGNLYVTDLSQRVTVISSSGAVLRRWGKPGTGPGEFKFIANDPTAPTDVAGRIAVGRNGMVYISDSGNDRVQVFTPQGRFIRQFGSYGARKGQFFFPGDLVVDGSGNVYVTDDQSQTLAKFSPSGKVIWRIGGSASSDPDLLGHQHLASIDAHGRLVMVNDDQGRVLYVNPSGHKVDAFSPDSSSFTGGHVCEVTVDAAGDTYVSGCGPGPTEPTLVYNRAHRLIAKWPGSTYKLLRSPAFGPDGEVFALSTDGSILRLRITLPAG
jgi:sugar lactone lactonase YvrE